MSSRKHSWTIFKDYETYREALRGGHTYMINEERNLTAARKAGREELKKHGPGTVCLISEWRHGTGYPLEIIHREERL